jgi:hypothetical protein
VAYLEIDGNAERRLEHIVARDLGMTVARMRTEMSQTEWNCWVAFYSIEAQEREVNQGGRH